MMLVVLWACLTAGVGRAQTLESSRRTNGLAVHACFEPAREVLQRSSAVILQGSKKIAYGTVFSADGLIATKASEIDGAEGLRVTVGSKTYDSPELLGVDLAWDVALLRVPASGLEPVNLVESDVDLPRGTWVVANGATTRIRRRVQVGIVSASAREIPAAGGVVLGVTLDEKRDRWVVTKVHEGSGAELAGLRAGDRIVAVGEAKMKDREALDERLAKLRVGDELKLVVERAGERLDLQVRVSGRADLFGEEKTRNDEMSGRFSERRSGFPRIIQHDILANAAGMGGPLLGIDGRCHGMNIARANRSETFAIPAGELRAVIDRLKPAAGP